MTDFLTAVSTKKTKDSPSLIQEVKKLDIQDHVQVDSKDSALQALKNEPNSSTVSMILQYLKLPESSLLLPEPLNASITYQLVNGTIPNYWGLIKGTAQAKLIAQILQNPNGLGHLITRLRSLIADSKQKQTSGESRNKSEHIEDVLDLLDRILTDDQTSALILEAVLARGKSVLQKKLIWKEYLSQTVSGRVLSVAAEAEDVLKATEPLRTDKWISNGKEYASWLGRNIAIVLRKHSKNEEYITAVVETCSKALGLGYTG